MDFFYHIFLSLSFTFFLNKIRFVFFENFLKLWNNISYEVSPFTTKFLICFVFFSLKFSKNLQVPVCLILAGGWLSFISRWLVDFSLNSSSQAAVVRGTSLCLVNQGSQVQFPASPFSTFGEPSGAPVI